MHDEVYNCLLLGCREHGYNYGRAEMNIETKTDYTNKYVIIKASSLVMGMGEIALRVFLVKCGFGATGAVLSWGGGKCFGVFVSHDSDDYVRRTDIERLATDDEIKAAKNYHLTKRDANEANPCI